MKTRLEKLEEILEFHRGECLGCQKERPKHGGHCIPERLILELIDEEKKLIQWRKLS